ncbi:MAG: hypothetical protein WB615_00355 [Candidatus Tumulicola sp.]
MPLVAENIEQARTAYAALESRAVSAETHVATLQASIQTLSAVVPVLLERNTTLTNFTAGQVQQNSQLVSQQATQVSPDTPLAGFIASLGLAAALGEATMPDRTVNSLASTVQCFLSLSEPAADGSRSVGLRFYQPELGAPTALATTSFEIAKTPAQPGTSAPRSLYSVFSEKQTLFGDPFWAPFVTGSPPVSPAVQVAIESTKILSVIPSWTFAFLVQESSAIAVFETNLAAILSSGATAASATPFAAAVAALTALVKRLTANAGPPVAGDLYALAAALDLTTKTAALIG